MTRLTGQGVDLARGEVEVLVREPKLDPRDRANQILAVRPPFLLKQRMTRERARQVRQDSGAVLGQEGHFFQLRRDRVAEPRREGWERGDPARGGFGGDGRQGEGDERVGGRVGRGGGCRRRRRRRLGESLQSRELVGERQAALDLVLERLDRRKDLACPLSLTESLSQGTRGQRRESSRRYTVKKDDDAGLLPLRSRARPFRVCALPTRVPRAWRGDPRVPARRAS